MNIKLKKKAKKFAVKGLLRIVPDFLLVSLIKYSYVKGNKKVAYEISRLRSPRKHPISTTLHLYKASLFLGDEANGIRILLDAYRKRPTEQVMAELFRAYNQHSRVDFVLLGEGPREDLSKIVLEELSSYLENPSSLTNLELLRQVYRLAARDDQESAERIKSRILMLDNTLEAQRHLFLQAERVSKSSDVSVVSVAPSELSKVYSSAVFKTNATASYILIDGMLAGKKKVNKVSILYNGRVVAELPVNRSRLRNIFTIRIYYSAEFNFDNEALIEARFGKRIIPNTEGGTGYSIRHSNMKPGVPPLSQLIDEGYVLTKKGSLNRPESSRILTVPKLVETMQEVDSIFTSLLNVKPFILYGTLLGIIRDQGIIPDDDDIDIGFFLDVTTPELAKKNLTQMLKTLLENGHKVALGVTGRMFKMFVRDVWVDVFAIWQANGYCWGFRPMKTRKSAFVPVRQMETESGDLTIPNNPELALASIYGENWRIPMSGFVHRWSKKARDYLSRSFLSPADEEDLRRYMRNRGIPDDNLSIPSAIESSVN